MLVYPSSQLSDIQEVIAGYTAKNCFLLYDKNTLQHCDKVIRTQFSHLNDAKRIVIPAGEQYKSLDQSIKIWDTLVAGNANRNSVLINIGGGVITDIGGFCASNFKRGIDFINIPTSLLGMVDASIGGKNGVNFRNIKNQIGTFSKPKCVYLNTDFLETLPRNELHSGLSEMIKHVLLFDPNALELILKRSTISEWISEEGILKSINYKLNIVEKDYHDNGQRQSLNFGHTIGHAIESLSHTTKKPLLHGEAILLGMMEELKLSENRFNTPVKIRAVLKAVKKVFFPILDFKYRFEKLIPYLNQDKKNASGIGFSLLEDVAKPKLKVMISIEELQNELA